MDVSREPLPSCPQLCLRDSIRFCTIEASKRVPLLLLRLTRLGPLLLLRLTRLGLFDAMLFLDAKQGVRLTAATPCGFGDRLFCLVNLGMSQSHKHQKTGFWISCCSWPMTILHQVDPHQHDKKTSLREARSKRESAEHLRA